MNPMPLLRFGLAPALLLASAGAASAQLTPPPLADTAPAAAGPVSTAPRVNPPPAQAP
ncbi:MAG: hypothetical protein JWO72_2652, partial [Caulobacteraceae bacterium]|nr:hypothetical protein [Caulobacteraceae bacterium]